MLEAEAAVPRAQQMLTVCNACRYCEQYCPVFPAIERRTAFPVQDLHYLANLCHNCGECLYACQYAPPHPFGVNVPRALAEVRAESYEQYCWPRPLAVAFRRQGASVALGLTAAFTGLLWGGVRLVERPAPGAIPGPGDFYAVMPHDVMVGLFGFVFLFAVTALAVSLVRYWQTIRSGQIHTVAAGTWLAALGEGVRLRHLQGGGVDCASALDDRKPWRRWAHHATLAGFALCLASTTVAAIYHSVFGWMAPHGYLSAPVVLGVLGGAGLVIGPVGLLAIRAHRDPLLGDPAQRGFDTSLIVLLLLTSTTGLVLLALRNGAAMRPMLFLHLGAVLAFFVTIPYSKFVHGFYRTLALVQSQDESRREKVLGP
jgi:citrate/tricarballylate utilization protein